jgi:hypothetical protein
MKSTTSRTIMVIALLALVAILFVAVWKNTAIERSTVGLGASSLSHDPGVELTSAAANDTQVGAGQPTKPTGTATTNHWAALFGASQDYYEFVSVAASSAIDGDGRAAFYVREALVECADIMVLQKRVADLERTFQEDLNGPFMPTWKRDDEMSRFHRCIHLAKEDAFAHLPVREGGYPYKFWEGLALDKHDPVAEADQVASEMLKLADLKSGVAKQQVLDRVQNYMRDAITSKDPEAIYLIGHAGAMQNLLGDPIRGFAMSLAACDLGYDCSVSNKRSYWRNCGETGSCGVNAAFADFLQQTLGADSYSRAYREAQEFKELLSRDDWAGLEKYITGRQ